MNKERLLQLAEVLESDEAAAHFYMGSFFNAESEDVEDDMDPAFLGEFPDEYMNNHCGTTACIAGWAIVKFRPKYSGSDYMSVASELLELYYDDAKQLFMPVGYMNETDPKAAAKVVRHFVETGDVDWDIIDFAEE